MGFSVWRREIRNDAVWCICVAKWSPNVTPIHIEYFYPRTIDGIDEDNVITALGHPDRVSSICFALMEPTGPQSKFLRKMVTVMQEPFPALTHLFLSMLTSKDVAILGKICTMSTENCINQHSLSGITSASFVHQRSEHSPPFQHTPDWIHSTRGDGWGSGHIDQARISLHWISITDFPPWSNMPSRNTKWPFFSHLLYVLRCFRVFGGLRGTN